MKNLFMTVVAAGLLALAGCSQNAAGPETGPRGDDPSREGHPPQGQDAGRMTTGTTGEGASSTSSSTTGMGTSGQ